MNKEEAKTSRREKKNMKGCHRVGGKKQRKPRTREEEDDNKEHAESGTHLAASSSSSFLYSPRWLQKIMVSDNGLRTHTDHTHTHMIKQRAHSHTHM